MMHDPLSLPYRPKGLTPFALSNPRLSQLPQTPRPQLAQPPSQIAPAQLLPRDISHRFGFRLRELRRERRMTQLEMAVNFGIDRSFISDVERGRKSISLTFLEVIALGFKLDLAELLRGL